MERITTSETLWDVLGKVYDAVYRLQEIENILGDEYDLDQLKEMVEADRENAKTENQFGWIRERFSKVE